MCLKSEVWLYIRNCHWLVNNLYKSCPQPRGCCINKTCANIFYLDHASLFQHTLFTLNDTCKSILSFKYLYKFFWLTQILICEIIHCKSKTSEEPRGTIFIPYTCSQRRYLSKIAFSIHSASIQNIYKSSLIIQGTLCFELTSFDLYTDTIKKKIYS